MKRGFKVMAIGVTIAATMLTGAAHALPTPNAARTFCAANAAACAGGGAAMISATPDLMLLIKAVNREVNASIRFESDAGNTWALNPARGDCEDFAISKRSALVGQGVDPSALRLAFTLTSRGAPHAVLIVRTDQGDFVLDNLDSRVKSLRSSGYRLLAMSGSSLVDWN